MESPILGLRNTRAMRFGLISQWFDPEPGPAAIPGGLARELAARGHDVHVLTGFPNYPVGRIYEGYRLRPVSTSQPRPRMTVRRVALYPSHDDSTVRRLANYGSFGLSASTLGLGAMRGMDAIWVYNSPATVALPMWGARALWGVPHVLHIMDLWPDSILFGGFDAGIGGRAALRAVDAWVSAMYRSSAKVAYASPGLGAVLESRGVPADKLAYAPVWADPSVDTDAAPVSRAHWGASDDQLLVLYAGAVGAAQGLSAALTGLAQLQNPEKVVLLIAGSGTELGALRRQAAALGLPNVHFLGQLPRSELSGIMTSADLHIVSLRDSPLAHVSLPSKIHTTLALGKPLLAAVGGDAATVARESGAAFVAIPGDAASIAAELEKAVLMDRASLVAMGARGRSYYDSRFSLGVGVDRIESLLVQAAQSRRTQP